MKFTPPQRRFSSVQATPPASLLLRQRWRIVQPEEVARRRAHRQDDRGDQEPWGRRHPPGLVERLAPGGEDVPEGDGWRRDSETQERQRRLEDDGVGEAQRREHRDERSDLRHQVPEYEAGGGSAGGAGRPRQAAFPERPSLGARQGRPTRPEPATE